MDWPIAIEQPLGYAWDEEQLKHHFKVVYGGVAWPGKKPGFAVVVGLTRDKHFESSDVYLLDEFESADTRVLVRQCGVLHHKYQPQRWIGDRCNDAADRFIREMNDERQLPEDSENGRDGFYISWTPILDMQNPYEYMLPELKRLLDKERRQLILKDGKGRDYLAEIKPEEIPFLEFGAYPAIEALAFAVDSIRRDADLWAPRKRKRMEPPQSAMLT